MMPVRYWFIALVLLSVSAPLNATEPKYVCVFGKALVPCVRLNKPLVVWAYEFRYRPTKWIAIWPNNAVFGGRDNRFFWPNTELDDRSPVHPYDPAKPNIETLSPSAPTFDESFVDVDLAYSSTWMRPSISRYFRLENTSLAFHGDEVFGFWQQAAKRGGVVCAEFQVPYAIGYQTERHCAFARVGGGNSDPNAIDYCTFDEYILSSIRGSTTCTVVASSRHGVHRVLAARYPTTDYSGGASAGEFTCFVPSVPREKVVKNIEEFTRTFVGKSSKYASFLDGSELNYKAEGISIADDLEKMFLRAYIFGTFTNEHESKTNVVKFSMNIDLTVSAQASDDIIDYRQPNAAMLDRIRNRLEEKIRNRVELLSKKAYCKMYP